MSKKLVWNPQPAFQDYFYTEPSDIKKHRTVFRKEYTNFVSYGGRGSGKTYTFADAVIVEASIRKIRVLVTREIQDSIDESIKAELEKAIYARGLEGFFKITNTYIEGLNGSYFLFKGLKNNIRSVKSISNVDIALCEEAESISKVSWDTFLPSIRPESGRPIVIVIFNPASELDDTYTRWTLSPPPETISKLINWRDNKYFPPFLEKQRANAQKTMPKKDYDHIWEGQPTGSGGDIIIDLAWIKAARNASKDSRWVTTGDKIVGYDPAGQGRDFNAASCCDGNKLVAVDEWLRSPDLRIATERALSAAVDSSSTVFRYDKNGGFGDGVAVFVEDALKEYRRLQVNSASFIEIDPFDAGSGVKHPKQKIEGTEKTNDDIYSNAKAQAWGILAQLFYNTFRFIELGEDIEPDQLISIDIMDDDQFLKLARELSTPLWVKSLTNSKKKVEAKKDMEKRTGQASPNLADSLVMCYAPRNASAVDSFLSMRRSRNR